MFWYIGQNVEKPYKHIGSLILLPYIIVLKYITWTYIENLTR